MMQCTGTILVHVFTSFVFYMYIYLFLPVGEGTIRIGKYIGDQKGREKKGKRERKRKREGDVDTEKEVGRDYAHFSKEHTYTVLPYYVTGISIPSGLCKFKIKIKKVRNTGAHCFYRV